METKNSQRMISEAIRKIALGRSIDRVDMSSHCGTGGVGTARLIHGYVAKVNSDDDEYLGTIDVGEFPDTLTLISGSTGLSRVRGTLFLIISPILSKSEVMASMCFEALPPITMGEKVHLSLADSSFVFPKKGFFFPMHPVRLRICRGARKVFSSCYFSYLPYWEEKNIHLESKQELLFTFSLLSANISWNILI